MSVQRQSIPPKDAELETTAELPVLDVAAYETALSDERTGSTDTWHMPALNMQAAQAAASSSAAAEGRTTQLETDLRALSENLRDVEERLTRKGERLIELERELADARAERLAVDERAALLVSEAEARSAAAIAEAEQRTALLVAAADQRAGTAAAELASQLALRERELHTARSDLRESETRAVQYLEALQTLEGRRAIYDEQFLALERELYARDAQLAQLRQELVSRDARSQNLDADMAARQMRIGELERSAIEQSETITQCETQIAAGEERITALEREIAAARAESAERAATIVRLEGEREGQINGLAAAQARSVELERRLEDNAEVISQLQEGLRSALNRGTDLEGDLHAAEDAINRLEGEMRAKSTKLEELTKTHEEWRNTIEGARHSLAERDSLIQRLETEAANSVVLLGNIQQSIRRLDTSQSGGHDVAPEGAVRLLIRADGDSEVVHVLGRKTTVGRTPDNDLQIDAKFISRNHAVILAGPNHTIIEDLNSTNGVAVNGKRISRHTLQDGDAVAIGRTTFRFAVRPAQERR